LMLAAALVSIAVQTPGAGAPASADDAEHQAYRKTYNTRPALRLLQPLQVRIQAGH
jgi:hypothetical protein